MQSVPFADQLFDAVVSVVGGADAGVDGAGFGV